MSILQAATSGIDATHEQHDLSRTVDTPREADVLVIFGISGDLAKIMTFRSLYRLERRGLLHCPVVGVAVGDWSVEELREHAQSAIVAGGETLDPEVFARFANRLSYVAGDFAEPSRRGGSCSRCSTRRHPSTPTRRARGGRRPRTVSSPASAAGAAPG